MKIAITLSGHPEGKKALKGDAVPRSFLTKP
jgi:hypothetical protein